ncbi:FadR/GntR family transcriptional regulator [Lentzea sp. NPDC058450]|uniref:FadR/GntR family transcriptional regulator n=1 Tax=Lentzea sp. NPDC058450 TaxID=3346505 RepID=UPI00364EEED2
MPEDSDLARAFQIEPVSAIADRVAAQVQDYIVTHDLAEGARLPSERRLAELVGRSRPTVSQALRRLAVRGLIDIRPGAGAFVRRRPDAVVGESFQLMVELAPDSIDELVRLRYLLEQGAAGDILCTGSDLTALEQALERLRQARGCASEWISADTNFHVELVRLAGNRYLTSLFESAHGAVAGKAYDRWIAADELPWWLRGEEFEKQIALHEPMFTALREGNRDALLVALKTHQEALLTHLA